MIRWRPLAEFAGFICHQIYLRDVALAASESCNMETRKSVLLVNDEWGTEKGGISTIHRQIARLLKDSAYDVHALTLTANNKDDSSKCRVTLIEPCISEALMETKPNLDWFINHRSYFPDLDKITNVHAIVGHLPITGVAAGHLRKELFPSAKLILFNHVIPEDIEVHKKAWTPERVQERENEMFKAASTADVVISVGPRMFKHFDNKYRAHQRVTHKMFLPKPDEKFFDVQIQKPDKVGKIQVITFGRIRGVERLKGYDLVTEALSRVANHFNESNDEVPVWNIRGVPDGEICETKTFLRKFTKSDKLHINIYPYGSQDEIRKDLQQSHLCVMASRSEPFGLVGMEAIATGLPVLVTKNSGLAEYLEKHFPHEAEHMIVDVGINNLSSEKDIETWNRVIRERLRKYDLAFKRAQDLKERLKTCDAINKSHQEFIQLFTE
ncbi:uncharacterized protein LOC144350436 [Saccoglossus kowalevskii]